jgi:hypothetical protein
VVAGVIDPVELSHNHPAALPSPEGRRWTATCCAGCKPLWLNCPRPSAACWHSSG